MPKKINSCQKGKSGERECAELLRSYGYIARRGKQYSGNEDSPDVVSDLDFHIEVKRVEALNLYGAVEQSKRDCNSNRYAIFHRKNNREWVTILDSGVFLETMNSFRAMKKENERLKDIEEKFNALTR